MFRAISRFFKIAYVMGRYRIEAVVFEDSRFFLLRVTRFFNPWFYWPSRLSRGERLRLALETLGPIFVKFGQMLSTRKDLIPADITQELALLQDRVKPFSGELAKTMIKKALHQSPETLFAEFESVPLASASIAQVHAAKLKSGESVVIKVLRPKVKHEIQRDLALLTKLASFMQKYHPRGDRIRPKDIVEEFAVSLKAELDLQREAANAAQLRRNMQNNPHCYIPQIYWEYTAEKVMVMERISGIPVADIEALKAQGTDLKQLAETALRLFFKQVFNDNFFHADMHPGNIFISKNNPQQFILIDFGIVGSLAEEDQRYVAENFLAFFKRDYHRVARLHIDAGWVDPNTRVFELESAIRAVSEPVFEKPLKDISIGQLLLRLFQIARRFNMNIQPQLILLQKTLLNLEGLGRDLNPDLDLWQTAQPFLEKWVRERYGLKGTLRELKRQLPYLIEKLPALPELVLKALENLAEK